MRLRMLLKSLVDNLEKLAAGAFLKDDPGKFYKRLHDVAVRFLTQTPLRLKTRLHALTALTAIYAHVRSCHGQLLVSADADNFRQYLFMEMSKVLIGIDYLQLEEDNLTKRLFKKTVVDTKSVLQSFSDERFFDALENVMKAGWSHSTLLSMLRGDEISKDTVCAYINEFEHEGILRLRIDALLSSDCEDLSQQLMNQCLACDVFLDDSTILLRRLLYLHKHGNLDDFHQLCSRLPSYTSREVLKKGAQVFSCNPSLNLLLSQTLFLLDWVQPVDFNCTKFLLRNWMVTENQVGVKLELLQAFDKILSLVHDTRQKVIFIDVVEDLFGVTYSELCSSLALHAIHQERHRLDCARLYTKTAEDVQNANRSLAEICFLLIRLYRDHPQMNLCCMLSWCYLWPTENAFFMLERYFTAVTDPPSSVELVPPNLVSSDLYTRLYYAVELLRPESFKSSSRWSDLKPILLTYMNTKGFRYDANGNRFIRFRVKNPNLDGRPKKSRTNLALSKKTNGLSERTKMDAKTAQVQQVASQSSSTQAETSSTQPESSTVQSESSTVQSESSTLEHESSTVQSESSTVQSESSSTQRESSTVQPESSTVQPESSTVQSESSTLQLRNQSVSVIAESVQHGTSASLSSSSNVKDPTSGSDFCPVEANNRINYQASTDRRINQPDDQRDNCAAEASVNSRESNNSGRRCLSERETSRSAGRKTKRREQHPEDLSAQTEGSPPRDCSNEISNNHSTNLQFSGANDTNELSNVTSDILSCTALPTFNATQFSEKSNIHLANLESSGANDTNEISNVTSDILSCPALPTFNSTQCSANESPGSTCSLATDFCANNTSVDFPCDKRSSTSPADLLLLVTTSRPIEPHDFDLMNENNNHKFSSSVKNEVKTVWSSGVHGCGESISKMISTKLISSFQTFDSNAEFGGGDTMMVGMPGRYFVSEQTAAVEPEVFSNDTESVSVVAQSGVRSSVESAEHGRMIDFPCPLQVVHTDPVIADHESVHCSLSNALTLVSMSEPHSCLMNSGMESQSSQPAVVAASSSMMSTVEIPTSTATVRSPLLSVAAVREPSPMSVVPQPIASDLSDNARNFLESVCVSINLEPCVGSTCPATVIAASHLDTKLTDIEDSISFTADTDRLTTVTDSCSAVADFKVESCSANTEVLPVNPATSATDKLEQSVVAELLPCLDSESTVAKVESARVSVEPSVESAIGTVVSDESAVLGFESSVGVESRITSLEPSSVRSAIGTVISNESAVLGFECGVSVESSITSVEPAPEIVGQLLGPAQTEHSENALCSSPSGCNSSEHLLLEEVDLPSNQICLDGKSVAVTENSVLESLPELEGRISGENSAACTTDHDIELTSEQTVAKSDVTQEFGEISAIFELITEDVLSLCTSPDNFDSFPSITEESSYVDDADRSLWQNVSCPVLLAGSAFSQYLDSISQRSLRSDQNETYVTDPDRRLIAIIRTENGSYHVTSQNLVHFQKLFPQLNSTSNQPTNLICSEKPVEQISDNFETQAEKSSRETGNSREVDQDLPSGSADVGLVEATPAKRRRIEHRCHLCNQLLNSFKELQMHVISAHRAKRAEHKLPGKGHRKLPGKGNWCRSCKKFTLLAKQCNCQKRLKNQSEENITETSGCKKDVEMAEEMSEGTVDVGADLTNAEGDSKCKTSDENVECGTFEEFVAVTDDSQRPRMKDEREPELRCSAEPSARESNESEMTIASETVKREMNADTDEGIDIVFKSLKEKAEIDEEESKDSLSVLPEKYITEDTMLPENRISVKHEMYKVKAELANEFSGKKNTGFDRCVTETTEPVRHTCQNKISDGHEHSTVGPGGDLCATQTETAVEMQEEAVDSKRQKTMFTVRKTHVEKEQHNVQELETEGENCIGELEIKTAVDQNEVFTKLCDQVDPVGCFAERNGPHSEMEQSVAALESPEQQTLTADQTLEEKMVGGDKTEHKVAAPKWCEDLKASDMLCEEKVEDIDSNNQPEAQATMAEILASGIKDQNVFKECDEVKNMEQEQKDQYEDAVRPANDITSHETCEAITAVKSTFAEVLDSSVDVLTNTVSFKNADLTNSASALTQERIEILAPQLSGDVTENAKATLLEDIAQVNVDSIQSDVASASVPTSVPTDGDLSATTTFTQSTNQTENMPGVTDGTDSISAKSTSRLEDSAAVCTGSITTSSSECQPVASTSKESTDMKIDDSNTDSNSMSEQSQASTVITLKVSKQKRLKSPVTQQMTSGNRSVASQNENLASTGNLPTVRLPRNVTQKSVSSPANVSQSLKPSLRKELVDETLSSTQNFTTLCPKATPSRSFVTGRCRSTSDEPLVEVLPTGSEGPSHKPVLHGKSGLPPSSVGESSRPNGDSIKEKNDVASDGSLGTETKQLANASQIATRSQTVQLGSHGNTTHCQAAPTRFKTSPNRGKELQTPRTDENPRSNRSSGQPVVKDYSRNKNANRWVCASCGELLPSYSCLKVHVKSCHLRNLSDVAAVQMPSPATASTSRSNTTDNQTASTDNAMARVASPASSRSSESPHSSHLSKRLTGKKAEADATVSCQSADVTDTRLSKTQDLSKIPKQSKSTKCKKRPASDDATASESSTAFRKKLRASSSVSRSATKQPSPAVETQSSDSDSFSRFVGKTYSRVKSKRGK